MSSFIKNALLFIAVLLVSYVLAIPVADLLKTGGSFGDFRFFVGYPLVYIFGVFLLYIPFGGKYKYWWIVVTLIPALIYEFHFLELDFIYIPIIFAIVGWLVGYGILKLKSRFLKK